MSTSTQGQPAKDPRQSTPTTHKLPTIKLMRRLMGYITASRGRFWLAMLLVLVSVLLAALLPYLMGLAINIIGGQGAYSDLLGILVAMVALRRS
jgi:ABC-type multidrug transport system fused ATPase/permease subunit